MNVRLLRKIQKHILAEPRRFKMSGWVTRKEDGNEKAWDTYVEHVAEWKFAKCGTAACIGGWAVILGGELDRAMKNVTYGQVARDLLGISLSSSKYLFTLSLWPDEFQEKFRNARTLKARAQTAAARIDHFIKTEGRE